jgi:single-strand DNA-binding protein
MATFTATGRVGRDAEVRTIQSGDKVASFSIAYDTGFGDKKVTHWIDCALWGKRGEALAQYLTKGTLVEVSGEPTVKTYESKGATKAVIQLRLHDVKLHGGGKRDEPVADKASATRRDDMDDDLPF